MEHHRKVKLLFNEFDSHGPWVLDCLLSEIYGVKGYYIDFSDKDYVTLFANDVCKKPVPLVGEIVVGCVRRGIFNKAVFDSFKILTSDRIQENYIDATAERRRKGTFIELRSDLLLLKMQDEWKNIQITGSNSILPRNNPLIPVKNPQRREEKSKEDKIRGDEGGKFSPPPPDASNFKKIEDLAVSFKTDQYWCEQAAMKNSSDIPLIHSKIDEFVEHLKISKDTLKTEKDFAKHFFNWVRKTNSVVKNGKSISGGFPDNWDLSFEKKLEGAQMSKYWKHLRDKGLAPVRNRFKVVVDWLPVAEAEEKNRELNA